MLQKRTWSTGHNQEVMTKSGLETDLLASCADTCITTVPACLSQQLSTPTFKLSVQSGCMVRTERAETAAVSHGTSHVTTKELKTTNSRKFNQDTLQSTQTVK